MFRRTPLVAVLASLSLLCLANPAPATVRAAATTSGDPTLVAAGDIACNPTTNGWNGGNGTATACREKATSDLLVGLQPTAIAVLGDNQYESGSLTEYNAGFDPSWGRVKPLIHPAIGNHEIKTDPKAGGFFSYFGAAAGPAGKAYYSYDLGTWHIVVLNGNCSMAGCAAGSAQEQWLKADLAAHPTACTLAYWHQPRFSSGNHGSSTAYDPFWRDLYAAGTEIVLNGHDHDYERFAPQTPGAVRDDAKGIREFVVGTGGRSFEPMSTVKANSQVRKQVFGVLQLTLHAGSYDWSYVPVSGSTFTDSGTGYCH